MRIIDSFCKPYFFSRLLQLCNCASIYLFIYSKVINYLPSIKNPMLSYSSKTVLLWDGRLKYGSLVID